FHRCLVYAQYLWTRGHAARAILAADRGLLADLRGDEPALATYPLPYAALAWMIAHTPAGVFIGNPRIHYQHLADRVREPRRAQRSARAWACWHLARLVRPDLPADPRHAVVEPDEPTIMRHLESHGIPGETAAWRQACIQAAAWSATTTSPDRTTSAAGAPPEVR
ncbi:MAG: hypothetical protein IAE82_16890, partial [Opitutaceae bacterium]|nr:hypothetical protein [Opitutaceae bacterium]